MKDLKDLSVVELKALAYDQIGIVERASKLLQVINQLIIQKEKEAKE